MSLSTTSNNTALTNDVVETDKSFPKESRRRAEDILEEIKATYHVQVFSGVNHGFGTRGDPDVENTRMFYKPLKFLDYH
jgi:dienelactone hydrolase